MTTVFKIENGAESVEFYSYECPIISVKSVQNIDLFQIGDSDNTYYGKMGYYKIGKRYLDINLAIRTYYNTTMTRIKTVKNWKDDYHQPQIVKIYYEYAISTTTHCWGQLVRETACEYYAHGQPLDTNEQISLRFIESRPEGTGVVYKNISGVG